MAIRKSTSTAALQARRAIRPAEQQQAAKHDAVDDLKTTGTANTSEKPAVGSAEVDELLAFAEQTAQVAEAKAVAAIDITSHPEVRPDARLGQDVDNRPSQALRGQARILDPRLMDDEFAALLDKPFTPSREVTGVDGRSSSPTEAQLPAERVLPNGHGKVSYAHDGDKLTITGLPNDGGKPEVLTRNVPLGKAAQFAAAFDTALAKKFPKWDPDERAPELWVAFADTQKAAARAIKIDDGQRSVFDAASLLRSYCPKAEPLTASKATMDQIRVFSDVAKAVVDGPSTPKQNVAHLAVKSLEAQGRSLLDEVLLDMDIKAGNLSEFGALLERPFTPSAPPELPKDDSAVVVRDGSREVTAGEVREMAFRKADALEFQIPGFADEHGSQHTLNIHLEKKGDDIAWSFYGVKGNRMGILSGTLSPEGVNDFLELLSKQPRYDMIPYAPKAKPVTPQTTQHALDGLEQERQRIQAELAERGGVSFKDIFPDFDG